MALARPLSQGQFVFMLIAFLCLAWSFISSNFSVAYVANNSNSTLPLGYRISALWRAHEGSLLLWALILSIWMLAVSIFSRSPPEAFIARVLGVMGNVQVSLSASLATDAKADDTLFIFARAASGPRMPLAIKKKQVRDLPIAVSLDDSMAMSPQLSLSRFEQVIISARISRSGRAMPEGGDLVGTSAVIHTQDVTSVKINIDQVLP